MRFLVFQTEASRRVTVRTSRGRPQGRPFCVAAIRCPLPYPYLIGLNLIPRVFAPGLFQELRGRYPDAPPSKDGLASFLSRSGFASAAVGPATKAYLETCYFLQREGAYESDGNDAPETADAMADEPTPETRMHPTTTSPAPQPQAHRAHRDESRAQDLSLNKINMNVTGAQVHLEALLDRKGIAALKKKLTSLEALLEDDDEEQDDRPYDEDRDPRD